MNILFADGTKGFSPRRYGSEPCGGILTSLTLLPRLLAAKGHTVYVKSLHDKTEDVERVHYLSFNQEPPKIDVTVFNRNMISNYHVEQAQKRGSKTVWWLHDIVDYRYLNDASFRRVDGIVALSVYCENSYANFYDIPHEKFTRIPNGVDKSRWAYAKDAERNRHLYLMASAPVKGYAPMQFVWHNIKRNDPEAELRIYSNQSLHSLDNNPQTVAWLKNMKNMGARVMDPIPQPELARVFREAWALLMPNGYPEICSNLILQAQACGLPVVTSPIGSAPEFIEHGVSGMLTCSFPHDLFLWYKDFAECVMSLMDPKQEIHREINTHAPENVLGWESVADRWEAYLESVCKVAVPA